MPPVILETRSLMRTFGAVVAANDLNVTIKQGEIVGVIGGNGAGKTTFINMVTGYLPPSSGEILFEAHSVVGMAPREITRRGMARSFQVAQLFPQLSVVENVMIALVAAQGKRPAIWSPMYTGERHAQALDILDEFSVKQFAYLPVSSVPQGVRKLVDIAMALVSRPRLLLLDEPTSGVSSEEKIELMDTVMRAVKKQSLTVLFVEHDMDIVTRYVSRILAFYSGEIIADGSAHKVMNDTRVQELVTGRHLNSDTTEVTR